MAKLTKNDIVRQIAKAHGTTQDAVRAPIDAMIDAMVDAIDDGQDVFIPGFGTFKPVSRDARQARNPRTGEMVDVPAKRVMTFKPAAAISDRLNP
jgi:DNA-binding protein HU-beta